jgi:hypothetical protein
MERGEHPFNPEEKERVKELLRDFEEHGFPVNEEDADNVHKIQMHEMGYTDEEGNPGTQLQRNVELRFKPNETGEEYLPPAVPADITPSKRKRQETDHKDLFVFSDAQIDFRRIIDHRTNEMELIPVHDPRAIRLAQMICKDLQPDKIINLGDTIDLASLSRFKPDSDHFHKTLGPSFQEVHDMYAQFRADNPDADIIEVDSNHNTRLRDFVLKNFPQIYDMYRPGEEEEYPIMTYPALANLGHLGVQWISGYGAAEYIHGDEYYEEIDGRTVPKPLLTFRHGTETSPNGTTASKIYKNRPETHNVQGHNHNAETYRRANRLGQHIGSIVVPPLCKTTGEVSGFHSAVSDKNRPVHYQENWTQGVLHIIDHDGEYEFNQITFRDGKAYYQGKEYDGNIE